MASLSHNSPPVFPSLPLPNPALPVLTLPSIPQAGHDEAYLVNLDTAGWRQKEAGRWVSGE